MSNGPKRNIKARVHETTKDPIRRYYNRLLGGSQPPLDTPPQDPKRLFLRTVSRTGVRINLPDILTEDEKTSLLADAGQGDAENRITDMVMWSYGGVLNGFPVPLTEELANTWTNASPASVGQTFSDSAVVWWQRNENSMPYSPFQLDYNFKNDFLRLVGVEPGPVPNLQQQILLNRELLEGITVADNPDLIISILQSIFDPIDDDSTWTTNTMPH